MKDYEIGRIPIMLRCAKCQLNNCTDTELQRYNECPYDPGGYFIIRGKEKIVLIQEQLAKNRIIVEQDTSKDTPTLIASITSSTAERKSGTELIFRNSRIELKHNSLKSQIRIAVIFKGLGIESDQEIVQLVGADLLHLLVPSLQASHQLRASATVNTPIVSQQLVCFSRITTNFCLMGLTIL